MEWILGAFEGHFRCQDVLSYMPNQ
jgi:hypothetical protein